MQQHAKRWSAAFALSLLLILSVTFWGLHDKVSLYETTAHGHLPVAKAKLLSGRELAADTANQAQAVLPPFFPALLFFALAPLLAPSVTERLRRAPSRVSSPPHSPAFARALDRRPPPRF